MRLAYENRASTRNSARSMPSRSGAEPPPLPKIAVPLVICSTRLTCRSNKGFAMDLPRSGSGDARANAGDVIENFVASLEPVVALQDDDARRVPRKRVFQEIEGRIRDWMAVGIRKQRLGERLITDRDAAGHVHLPDEARA